MSQLCSPLSSSIHDRLKRFAAVYAVDWKPDDIAFAYAGRTDELFAVLTARYGPEPSLLLYTLHSKALEPASHGETPDQLLAKNRQDLQQHAMLRRQVMWAFLRHCPERLLRVDDVLNAYRGREDQLLVDMSLKFGEKYSLSDTSNETSYMALRNKLKSFYEYHNPSKIAVVDDLLMSYAADPDCQAAIFDDLLEKYGLHPEHYMPLSTHGNEQKASLMQTALLGPLIESNATIANLSPGELGCLAITKQRLIVFYSHYCPEKVAHVDEILLLACGSLRRWRNNEVNRRLSKMRAAWAADEDKRDVDEEAWKEESLPREELTDGDDEEDKLSIGVMSTKLFAQLEAKYGPEPGKIALRQRSSSVQSGNSISSHHFRRNTSPTATRGVIVARGSSVERKRATMINQAKVEVLASPATNLAQSASSVEQTHESAQQVQGEMTTRNCQELELAVANVDCIEDVDGSLDNTNNVDRLWKSRLSSFYAFYCPEKLVHIDALLEYYKDKEAELLQRLVDKYGPEPALRDKAEMERLVASRVISAEFQENRNRVLASEEEEGSPDELEADGSGGATNSGEKRKTPIRSNSVKPTVLSAWDCSLTRARAATVFLSLKGSSRNAATSGLEQPPNDALLNVNPATNEKRHRCAAEGEPILQQITISSKVTEGDSNEMVVAVENENFSSPPRDAVKQPPAFQFIDPTALVPARTERRFSFATVVGDVFSHYRAHSSRILLAVSQVESSETSGQGDSTQAGKAENIQISQLKLACNRIRLYLTAEQLLALKFVIDCERLVNAEASERDVLEGSHKASILEFQEHFHWAMQKAFHATALNKISNLEELVRGGILDQWAYEAYVLQDLVAAGISKLLANVSAVQRCLPADVRLALPRKLLAALFRVTGAGSELLETAEDDPSDISNGLLLSHLRGPVEFAALCGALEQNAADAVDKEWSKMFALQLGETGRFATSSSLRVRGTDSPRLSAVPKASALSWMTLFAHGENRVKTRPHEHDAPSPQGTPAVARAASPRTPRSTRKTLLAETALVRTPLTFPPPPVVLPPAVDTLTPSAAAVVTTCAERPTPPNFLDAAQQLKLMRFRASRGATRQEACDGIIKAPAGEVQAEKSGHKKRKIVAAVSVTPGTFSRHGSHAFRARDK